MDYMRWPRTLCGRMGVDQKYEAKITRYNEKQSSRKKGKNKRVAFQKPNSQCFKKDCNIDYVQFC